MKTQKLANIIARKNGYGKATEVIIDTSLPKGTGRVLKHINRGYRKCSNGEYVSNAYLNNFGWKNTYYQHAVTIVAVNPDEE
jgi:hypothetical protein